MFNHAVIVDNPNMHLLSVHGDNKKTLVTNIPQDSLFALDKQLLDYTSWYYLHAKKRCNLALVRGVVRMIKL